MNIKKFLSIIVAFSLAITINTTFAAPKRLLPIEHWTTSEGVRVYFVPAKEIPMIDIQIVFSAGSARDPATQQGIAQLTNHMLLQGAGDLNADQIALGFESIGANVNQKVNRDMAVIHLRSLTTQLEPSLTLLTQVLSKPTFPTSAFDREKNRTLIAIQAQDQNPGTIASNAIYAEIYGEHPYGHAPIGTKKTVSILKPEDSKQFFKTYYVAENAIITIVGAVDRKQAESIANTIARALNRGKPAVALPTPKQASPIVKHITYPSSQTHIRMGTIGAKANDPDLFALRLGNHILGEQPLMSRLFKEVREKRGLSYHAGSAMMPLAVAGPFVIHLQTKTDQANIALDVAKTVLHDFTQNGPTDEELVRAKKDIEGSLIFSINSNANISSHITSAGFYQLPLDYLDTYIDRIKAVTVAQIKDAFKRRISEKMAVVSVGEDAKSTR